jgi:hypothetical protein
MPRRPSFLLATVTLLMGLAVILVALMLTVRTYMPCPFWDEWAVIDGIATGTKPGLWRWLWSQHNEHRLAITRLLVWLDLWAFGGRNVSLFVEIYLVQILQWAAICYVLERFTGYPTFLTRTLEGLFAFCLFHPNQAQNFTWAFQVSFLLSFALGTAALLAVAFFDRIQQRTLAAVAVGLAPLVAGLNLSAGLLIGPAVLCLALWKRLPARAIATVATIFILSSLLYFKGYSLPKTERSGMLSHGKDLFVYVLTYFGASWTRLVPHKERATAFISLVVLLVLVVRAVRDRNQITNFEWFAIAECGLMLATALITGAGRLQFGVGQAYAGRYQTPAMLCWGSLFSLLLIAFWRERPARFGVAQGGLVLLALLSVLTFPGYWRTTVNRADALRNACNAVMSGNYDDATAKKLFPSTEVVARGASLLRNVWRRP